MMEYKGYIGRVEYDDEAKILHGEVINIRDVITFQATNVDDIESAFRDSVNDYIDFCAEEGEEPEKPFSGKFVVRLTPEQHRLISLAAKVSDKSLNSWVTEHLYRDAEKELEDHGLKTSFIAGLVK
ncbi:type II toxin-antitoxin system HicB family antitoxin [Cohnella silvisoli]|uniref:Type II toxin-antitoxin system HicB family antitoxin n=1 Tax=Cohnella silvisoli TaxID=2873699 RepID=A0ABV1KZ80_9BACL|nr:type II toxin-antitoxin system HicB family antitoxin [Cohnella silvisoli]MCD9024284.1 type II toxin-antitoxin system HicB family antitoxin [Cohnella silvisoli]